MKLPRRKFLSLAGALALAPALSRVASALDYPTRPITIIVPFPAGGPVDTLARLLSEPMRLRSASRWSSRMSAAPAAASLWRASRAPSPTATP